MDEKILEIVIYMVSRIRENPENREVRSERGERGQFSDMSADLHSLGFTEKEISSAYSWMFDRYDGNFERLFQSPEFSSGATRVLAPRERLAVSSNAFGYLTRLVELGILRSADLEEIVEACVQSGRHNVTLDEMKLIVSGALFDVDTQSTSSGGPEVDDSWLIN